MVWIACIFPRESSVTSKIKWSPLIINCYRILNFSLVILYSLMIIELVIVMSPHYAVSSVKMGNISILVSALF